MALSHGSHLHHMTLACCNGGTDEGSSSGAWRRSNDELIDKILDANSKNDDKDLKKTDGKKKNKIIVPKLDDANWAGTKKAHLCTLILTEGDSAKAFALSGLSIIGRNEYGIFPLKGKLLNVRNATTSQILKNAELNRELQNELQTAEKYGDQLRNTLRKHTLTHLANKKPVLIERKMQNATNRLWACLADITDPNGLQPDAGTKSSNCHKNSKNSSSDSSKAKASPAK